MSIELIEMQAKVKDFCEKYGFQMSVVEDCVFIEVKNIEDKYFPWIKFNTKKKTVQLIGGNTDHCNIWFHVTRPDFTPEICDAFIKDLNVLADFEDQSSNFTIKELIDPEDWQCIAGIKNVDLCSLYNRVG